MSWVVQQLQQPAASSNGTKGSHRSERPHRGQRHRGRHHRSCRGVNCVSCASCDSHGAWSSSLNSPSPAARNLSRNHPIERRQTPSMDHLHMCLRRESAVRKFLEKCWDPSSCAYWQLAGNKSFHMCLLRACN